MREEISTLDGRKGEVVVKVPIPRTEIELRKKELDDSPPTWLAEIKKKKKKDENLELGRRWAPLFSFFLLLFSLFLA